MTEQEKREKAIEEMFKKVARCSIFIPWERWNCEKNCKYYPCAIRETCEKLYDAGYRKV